MTLPRVSGKDIFVSSAPSLAVSVSKSSTVSWAWTTGRGCIVGRATQHHRDGSIL